MESLFALSTALLAGLLMSRLAKLLKLPAVTAYLVAGLLIGPFCLGRLGITGLGFTSIIDAEQYSLFSNVALGFIAFSIGNEFRLSQLKQTGKQATIIGIVQALTATLCVDAALIGLHFIIGDKLPIPVAITLGAIATATAPAATLMVVRQYKAKGKLTDLLLPIVALDDAIGLIIFAVSFGIAKALVSKTIDPVSIFVNPMLEIIGSLLLGCIAGLLLTFVERFFHSNSKRLCISLTFVLLTVAASMLKFELGGGVKLSFSSLLVCMMMGTVFCNICDFSEELMERVDKWTAPLFVLFFVLSGAELELDVFADIAIVGIGIVYVVSRSIGKYGGSYLSAKATHCDKSIVNNLGITLLPQAGVALGMCITAMQLGGSDGALIRNIVLFAVLIYELVGPLLTKNALVRAGDIIPENKTSARIKK